MTFSEEIILRQKTVFEDCSEFKKQKYGYRRKQKYGYTPEEVAPDRVASVRVASDHDGEEAEEDEVDVCSPQLRRTPSSSKGKVAQSTPRSLQRGKVARSTPLPSSTYKPSQSTTSKSDRSSYQGRPTRGSDASNSATLLLSKGNTKSTTSKSPANSKPRKAPVSNDFIEDDEDNQYIIHREYRQLDPSHRPDSLPTSG